MELIGIAEEGALDREGCVKTCVRSLEKADRGDLDRACDIEADLLDLTAEVLDL